MTIKPEVLDAMLAAGCTREQIVAAVKADLASQWAEEESQKEREAARRETDRIRKRQKRHAEREAKTMIASAVSDGQSGQTRTVADGADNPLTPSALPPGPPIPSTPEPPPPSPPKGGSSPAKPGKRGSRLPENWTLPDGWGEIALSLGLPPGRVAAEAAKMLDWSLSSPNGAKSNWLAAWRSWVRRIVEENPQMAPKTNGSADPDHVSLAPDHPDFKAMERFKGKPIPVQSSSGRVTFKRSEIEQARKTAAPETGCPAERMLL